MTTEARATWRRIMKSVPAGFIPPHRYGLLRAHCEATASYERAVAKIKDLGEVIETAAGVVKLSPWVTVSIQMAAVMASTATKLGISWAKTRDVKIEEKPVSRREPHLLFGGERR
jgi:phage terminase small subunit